MQLAHRFTSAAALAFMSTSAFASTTVYNAANTFLPMVAAGSYTESFDGLNDASGVFSSGAFSFTVSAPASVYASGDFLGTSLPTDALTIDFTSGNVTALGANFYAVNLSNDFKPVAMTIRLSDGTVVSFTPASAFASYRGFTSDLTIASLVISAPGASLYASLDNLTIGSTAEAVPAVPEPTTWALMGLGLAGVAVATRRRA